MKLYKHGFGFGPRHAPWIFIVWPWKRRAEHARVDALIKQSAIASRREAARLRDLGASESAVFHCCYWVGNPPNSIVRRALAWIRGDFYLLHLLNEHKRQQQ